MTRPRILAVALVVAVVVAAYAGTITDYFVQDDFGVVSLLAQKPAGYFPRWFVSTWMDNIWGYTPDEVRPFPALSYQVAAFFGAGTPVSNHLINMAFHVGTALLVLAVSTHAAGIGLPAATFAAIVFALLPNSAETVAWVTGRVDSMPAFFYLASFLMYVRWRETAGPRRYYVSMLWCVVALFSKQNTITLGPALVLYDIVVLRRRVTPTWAWLRPYVPYAVLTAGYLLLRYELFGEVVRENMLTMARAGDVTRDLVTHVVRVAVGAETVRGIAGEAIGVACAAMCASWALGVRRADPGRGSAAGPIVFFGVIWIVLGFAPTLVAGYASPRHAYLASVGWAIVAGIACDVLWHTRTPRRARIAFAVGAAVLLGTYAVELRESVANWHARAALSRKAVADLERVAMSAPEGTLIVVGVPSSSWAFALPFAAKPPFARADLTRRVALVSHSSLYCCAADQWDGYTRERLREWLAHPDRPPVIAMRWDAASHNLVSGSDAVDPSLRDVIALLLRTGDRVALDASILRLLNEFVAYRRGATR